MAEVFKIRLIGDIQIFVGFLVLISFFVVMLLALRPFEVSLPWYIVSFAVSYSLVLWWFFFYVMKRTCVFTHEGLYIERIPVQGVKYSSIKEVRGCMDTKQGKNGFGKIEIVCRKTLAEVQVFGNLPLKMKIEKKDLVLEILRSKCKDAMFS